MNMLGSPIQCCLSASTAALVEVLGVENMPLRGKAVLAGRPALLLHHRRHCWSSGCQCQVAWRVSVSRCRAGMCFCFSWCMHITLVYVCAWFANKTNSIMYLWVTAHVFVCERREHQGENILNTAVLAFFHTDFSQILTCPSHFPTPDVIFWWSSSTW